MADKNKFSDAFRDSFLNRDIEPETTDGWVSVSRTLRRRAVTRKVVAASSSLAAIAALMIVFGVRDVEDIGTDVVADVVVAESVLSFPEILPVPGNTVAFEGTEVGEVNTASADISAAHVSEKEAEPVAVDVTAQETPVYAEQTVATPSENRRQKKTYSDIDTDGKKITASNDVSDRKNYQFGFSARGMLASTGSFSNISAGVLGFLSKEWSKETPETPRSMSKGKFEYKHFIPVGAGINIGIPVSKSLTIDTGIDYTFLHSQRTVMGKTDQQYLHMLGIPLSLNWNKSLGKGFVFYAGAGGEMEKCLKAILGSETINEKQLQWSVFADFGFQYFIYSNLSIYLQPEFSYYFTDTSLETFRSGSGLGISARAGLRIGL